MPVYSTEMANPWGAGSGCGGGGRVVGVGGVDMGAWAASVLDGHVSSSNISSSSNIPLSHELSLGQSVMVAAPGVGVSVGGRGDSDVAPRAHLPPPPPPPPHRSRPQVHAQPPPAAQQQHPLARISTAAACAGAGVGVTSSLNRSFSAPPVSYSAAVSATLPHPLPAPNPGPIAAAKHNYSSSSSSSTFSSSTFSATSTTTMRDGYGLPTFKDDLIVKGVCQALEVRVLSTASRLGAVPEDVQRRLNLVSFADNILCSGLCTKECLVIAHIYGERLVRKRGGAHAVTPDNVYRMFLVTLMVASKFLDDFYCRNMYFALLGGLTNAALNELELQLCFMLDFDLHVTPAEFESTALHISAAASLRASPAAWYVQSSYSSSFPSPSSLSSSASSSLASSPSPASTSTMILPSSPNCASPPAPFPSPSSAKGTPGSVLYSRLGPLPASRRLADLRGHRDTDLVYSSPEQYGQSSAVSPASVYSTSPATPPQPVFAQRLYSSLSCPAVPLSSLSTYAAGAPQLPKSSYSGSAQGTSAALAQHGSVCAPVAAVAAVAVAAATATAAAAAAAAAAQWSAYSSSVPTASRSHGGFPPSSWMDATSLSSAPAPASPAVQPRGLAHLNMASYYSSSSSTPLPTSVSYAVDGHPSFPLSYNPPSSLSSYAAPYALPMGGAASSSSSVHPNGHHMIVSLPVSASLQGLQAQHALPLSVPTSTPVPGLAPAHSLMPFYHAHFQSAHSLPSNHHHAPGAAVATSAGVTLVPSYPLTFPHLSLPLSSAAPPAYVAPPSAAGAVSASTATMAAFPAYLLRPAHPVSVPLTTTVGMPGLPHGAHPSMVATSRGVPAYAVPWDPQSIWTPLSSPMGALHPSACAPAPHPRDPLGASGAWFSHPAARTCPPA